MLKKKNCLNLAALKYLIELKQFSKQSQLVLYSILQLKQNKDIIDISTGEVYETYKQTVLKFGQKPVTMTTMSRLITGLDTLGLIQTKIVSKGRYGRTKEINVSLTEQEIREINKILEQRLNLKKSKK